MRQRGLSTARALWWWWWWWCPLQKALLSNYLNFNCVFLWRRLPRRRGGAVAVGWITPTFMCTRNVGWRSRRRCLPWFVVSMVIQSFLRFWEVRRVELSGRRMWEGSFHPSGGATSNLDVLIWRLSFLESIFINQFLQLCSPCPCYNLHIVWKYECELFRGSLTKIQSLSS